MWGMGEIASISGGGYAARAKQVLSVLLVMSPVDQAPCLSSVMIGASAGHYGELGMSCFRIQTTSTLPVFEGSADEVTFLQTRTPLQWQICPRSAFLLSL